MNQLLQVADNNIKLSEIFASIQGEGLNTGVPSIFLRLALCNLSCPTCDTGYTWAFLGTNNFSIDVATGKKVQFSPEEEIIATSSEKIYETIINMSKSYTSPITNIVLTGGEPLMHQRSSAFIALMRELKNSGFAIEIETNGTLKPNEAMVETIDQFNVSPKLSSFNSVNNRKERWVDKSFVFYSRLPKAIFKFVITGKKDLEELRFLQKKYDIDSKKILLMPEGRTQTELDKRALELVGICKDNGYRFCNRLHVQIFGGALRKV